jgi:ATP-binding protein involved in chromosome partitioning
MISLEEVYVLVKDVRHPAIDHTLFDLGIIKEVDLDDGVVSVVFAFPFPNIPIEDQLVGSVATPLVEKGAEFRYKVDLMTEEERNKFLAMEAEAWKGSAI